MNISRISPVSFKSVRIVEAGMNDQTKRAAHMMAGKLTENHLVDSLKNKHNIDIYIYQTPKADIFGGKVDNVLDVSFVADKGLFEYDIYKSNAMKGTALHLKTVESCADNSGYNRSLYTHGYLDVLKAMESINFNEFSKIKSKDSGKESEGMLRKLNREKYYEWNF